MRRIGCGCLGLGALLACTGLLPVPVGLLGFLLDRPNGRVPVGDGGMIGIMSMVVGMYSVPIGLGAGAISALVGAGLWWWGRPVADAE